MSASVIEGERELQSSKHEEYSDNLPSKSSSASRDSLEAKVSDAEKKQQDSKQEKDEHIDLPSPKLQPTAFTIDFGDGKSVDKSKLESLAKKSQARHQRVQSMSASLQRPTTANNAAQRPTMSAKLPRKTHGYNSEGYFSSDQEDSVFSTSTKIKQSSLAQNVDKNKTHNINEQLNFDSVTFRKTTLKNSPIVDNYHAKIKHSKSPIVDSIMSRSDTLPSKHNLNLPLKSNLSTTYANRDAYINPNYSNLSTSYHERTNHLNIITQVIDQSPDGQMITDISSPELDLLTPDNGLSSPEQMKNKHNSKLKRNIHETKTLQADIFKKCFARNENDDDNEIELDRQSNNSSTGTYTIEGDNYTEEQKARMSIDRVFAADNLQSTYNRSLRSPSREKDPVLIMDSCIEKVITKEPLPRNLNLRMPLSNETFQLPNRVSTDKNVLEITCCYESPTEMTELAVQTSKQIKSTRNYLEKIKNRVKTISEKTFQKPSPPKQIPERNYDIGSFTSVTTSGVLSSNNAPKPDSMPQVFKRKNSLTKSQVDSSEYIHRLTRESSVPVTLPSDRRVTDNVPFESTVLRSAQRAVENEHNIKSNISPEKLVGKLSYLSLNRCKGDKTWIQEWADSVKKYNKESLCNKDGDDDSELDRTSVNESVSGTSILSGLGGSSRPPASPRHTQGNKAIAVRCTISATSTPTKIPSPLAAAHARNIHQEGLSIDTEAYLRNTQNAISNLQAKLQHGPAKTSAIETNALTSSFTSEKVATSRLPVSQLSRSNSLNYRLRRRDSENSPLRSPENYVITGSANSAMPTSARLLLNTVNSRSLETRNQSGFDSNMNSPGSDKGPKSNSSDDKTLSNRPPASFRKNHSRHKSFDGRSSTDYLNSPTESLSPSRVSLKTVLKNNAIAEAQNSQYSTPIIEQTVGCQGDYGSISPRSQPHRTHTALSPTANIAFGNSIRRSSSFNTVNKNNNYIDAYSRNSKFNNSRRSSGNSENINGVLNDYSHKTSNIDVVDYNSDDSDNISGAGFYSDIDKRGSSKDVPTVAKYSNPIAIHRARLESPDLKSRAPANSPRCPNTPEMQRKFGPGLVRNTNARCASKERPVANAPRTDREKSQGQMGRKISDTTRQSIVNRLTKSKSSTKDFQHKSQNDKNAAAKKAPQYGSTASLASKEREFSKWKKRSSYDPMKAAREGRRRAQPQRPIRPKEELSSPSHSSPVHRSQSFNCTSSLGATAVPDYSSCSDTDLEEVDTGLYPLQCDVVLTRDYVAHFQVPAQDKRKLRPSTAEARPTEVGDLTTESWSAASLDETTQEGVVRRDTRKCANAGTNGQKRYSGDYSMSSSTTSISRETPARRARAEVAPRYLETTRRPAAPRAFLRRDPAKLYLLPQSERPANHAAASKGSAKQVELEQRNKELEKWKRRASYDPRKAAAQAKNKPAPKMTSSVLRSQSFHGPMHGAATLRYVPPPTTGDGDLYQDGSSDNDF